MGAIFFHLFKMIPFMAAGLPVYLFCRVAFLRHKKGSSTVSHEVLLGIFSLFLIGLASQTVLPQFRVGPDGISAAPAGTGGINLIPFATIVQIFRKAAAGGHSSYFIINILGNLGIFAPVGLFPPLLWKKAARWHRAVLTGFLLSSLIEILQLGLNRGTDVDDVILNTLGALAGYGMFWMLGRLWPGWKGFFRLAKEG